MVVGDAGVVVLRLFEVVAVVLAGLWSSCLLALLLTELRFCLLYSCDGDCRLMIVFALASRS